MMTNATPSTWRVLAIDDNVSIHQDYRKVLVSEDSDNALADAESALFGRKLPEKSKSKKFTYEIDSAFQGEEGLKLVEDSLKDGREYSVALVDVRMPPGWDGIETAKRIWEINPELPIVLCTAYSDYGWEQISEELPLTDQLLILKKPFEPLELRQVVAAQVSRWHLNRLADGNKKHLETIIRQRTQEVLSARDLVFRSLAKLAESRDPETGKHLERIETYTRVLLTRLAVSGPYTATVTPNYIDYVSRSSILHDIGKVGIPDDILLKPGRLTAEEFAVMKTHASIGADALSEAKCGSEDCDFLLVAEEIARSHHERFDGSGYPEKLEGTQIPLSARVVAVADVFDALTTVRTYKTAMCPLEAREIIESESGKHFDPAVVGAFVDCWDYFYESALIIQASYAHRSPIANQSATDTLKEELGKTVEVRL